MKTKEVLANVRPALYCHRRVVRKFVQHNYYLPDPNLKEELIKRRHEFFSTLRDALEDHVKVNLKDPNYIELFGFYESLDRILSKTKPVLYSR